MPTTSARSLCPRSVSPTRPISTATASTSASNSITSARALIRGRTSRITVRVQVGLVVGTVHVPCFSFFPTLLSRHSLSLLYPVVWFHFASFLVLSRLSRRARALSLSFSLSLFALLVWFLVSLSFASLPSHPLVFPIFRSN